MEQKSARRILKRFNTIKYICDNNTDDIDIKLKKEIIAIGKEEEDSFVNMFNADYIKNHHLYTREIIRERLLMLGYSIELVNYLVKIPEVQIEEIDIPGIEEINLNQFDFDWRANQILAIEETKKQNFASGVHNQYMGAGKSYIILKLISEHFAINETNGVYLLLCDRQEILKKMFFDQDHNIDEGKITKWREADIIDLTLFTIIDCVYHKPTDLLVKINAKNKDKPHLVICNNAYIKSKDYEEIRSKKILLTIVDECHSVSGKQFYKLLAYIKYTLKSPIIGFSATPLRKGADIQLANIFSKSMNESKRNKQLNIISQYGLFQCIQDDVILPPYYHYIEIKSNDKNKTKIGTENFDITRNIISEVLVDLPYKKIIGWCKNISKLIEWYNFFTKYFPQLKIYMSSYQDASLILSGYNCNFDEFCFRDGDAILLCINRCREGSDIPNLDCGIYLDAVRNRSLLVSLQTGGRIVRVDEAKLKTHGIMIDMFVSSPTNKIECITIDKIMEYYDQILNLSDNVNDIHADQTKLYDTYFAYKKLLQDTYFVEAKNEIVIKLDDVRKIRIHIELIDKQLDWSFIKDLAEDKINQTMKIDEELELRLNFKYMKETYDVKDFNPIDWRKFYKKLSKSDSKLLSLGKIYSDHTPYWENNNWFIALGINKLFYSTVDELVYNIYEFNIETFDDYKLIAKKNDNIPLDIMEFYGIGFDKLLDEINAYRKLKKSTKSKKFRDIEFG